ncbi:MAG: aminomethyl-transferring glycine dehydrogenase subunit GcvPB [Chlamydiia bacterium]|nr:aminomethyl-transferring glycine dehydrogenase subunit GcvPB [Chlamydiia bacterium]
MAELKQDRLQHAPRQEAVSAFEKSQKGQRAYSIPYRDPAFDAFQAPEGLCRQEEPPLPELSEIDLTRHFSQLARKNWGIDTNYYPLGSCTMKLNPRVNEWAASLPGFAACHPLAADADVQGCLHLIAELTELLCDVSGMTAGSLNPNAGAQGEFTGVKRIAAYHKSRGEGKQRCEMLIPDNAHGTNPATAQIAGFKCVSLPSNAQGDLDLDALREKVGERTAGLMLTNPNTLGIFSTQIREAAKIVHQAGGLLYYDGANLNPMLYVTRPGKDMGFDVMHMNLHKTFSTPHGGGGPGSGPVFCNERLRPFLPTPHVVKTEAGYRRVWETESSIGRMASFMGNFGIYLRAYLYFKLHGRFGLRRIAEGAVINANYLKKRMETYLKVPYSQPCMHEFVVQADRYIGQGVRALDIAKRLLDYGIHAPTVYFPLIVRECMLIEPTESESKATLDRFIEVIGKIVEEIEADPEFIQGAPYSLPVRRLDEVRAAKHPILKHRAS